MELLAPRGRYVSASRLVRIDHSHPRITGYSEVAPDQTLNYAVSKSASGKSAATRVLPARWGKLGIDRILPIMVLGSSEKSILRTSNRVCQNPRLHPLSAVLKTISLASPIVWSWCCAGIYSHRDITWGPRSIDKI